MPKTETCPVQLEEGLRRAGDDREFFRELLQMFADESAGQLEKLSVAASANDFDAVVRIAHCLKGASANLAAGPVTEAAYALEVAARDRRGGEVASLSRRLEQRIGDLNDFTREFE